MTNSHSYILFISAWIDSNIQSQNRNMFFTALLHNVHDIVIIHTGKEHNYYHNFLFHFLFSSKVCLFHDIFFSLPNNDSLLKSIYLFFQFISHPLPFRKCWSKRQQNDLKLFKHGLFTHCSFCLGLRINCMIA